MSDYTVSIPRQPHTLKPQVQIVDRAGNVAWLSYVEGLALINRVAPLLHSDAETVRKRLLNGQSFVINDLRY